MVTKEEFEKLENDEIIGSTVKEIREAWEKHGCPRSGYEQSTTTEMSGLEPGEGEIEMAEFKTNYSFPYYALMEIDFPKYGIMHIPLPFFEESEKRLQFALECEVSEKIRDNEFFTCPVCGTEKNFYAGTCNWCLDSEDNEENFESVDEKEILKRQVKDDFLNAIDMDLPLNINSASIILTNDESDRFWNLPMANKPDGEIISDVWKMLDEMRLEGKLPDRLFARRKGKLFYTCSGVEFHIIKNELISRVGYFFDMGLIFNRQNFGHMCARCGVLTEDVIRINDTDVCLDCCRDDPVGYLKHVGAYESGVSIIPDEYINPDLIEPLTRYMGVPSDAYTALFKGYVPTLIINCADAITRYFVIPPNIIPEYQPIFEEKYEEDALDIIKNDSEYIYEKVCGVSEQKLKDLGYEFPEENEEDE